MAPRILPLEVMGLRIQSSESYWKIQTAAARRNLSKKTIITMPTKTKKKKANRKERPRTGAEIRRNDESSGDAGVPIVPLIAVAIAVAVVMTILRIPAMRIEEGENGGNERSESRRLDVTPRGGERIPGGDANESAMKILVGVGTNGPAGRKDRKGTDQSEESSEKPKI